MKKLAIEGGTPAAAGLPGRFHFGIEEKRAVDALFDAAIESGNAPGYNGSEEEAFGREFATKIGAAAADGVNSGTNALFVALRALDLPLFSEVIVGAVNDPGGMMPIVLNNLIPVPADTMPGSFNTGAAEIEARITPFTSAVVIPHIGGEPADMPEILEVARKHGLAVVEDCSQSHAAKIGGRNVGTFGRYGSFSLMFGKHICAGGQGGAVAVMDEADILSVRRAADRAKNFTLPADQANSFATLNCNMDEIHAAIARAQLKKLDQIVARRSAAVEMLRGAGLKSIIFPAVRPNGKHCYWWLRLRFNAEAMRCTKAEFCAALAAEGLQMTTDYNALPTDRPWFTQREQRHPWNNPRYPGDPAKEYPIPNARAAIRDHFIWFVRESFGEREMERVIEAFRKVERHFVK